MRPIWCNNHIMKWTKKETDILCKYYGVIPTSDIIRIYLPDRNRGMLKYKARQIGLSADRVAMTSKAKRLYNVNSNYFSNNTLETFYWAGFIAADGCITDDGRLQLGVATKDLAHLKKFMRAVQYNGIITKSHGGRFHVVRISDQKIIRDLRIRFNIIPRKSLVLKPPNCCDRYSQSVAFAAGYIDGDGCIHINKEGRTELSCLGTLNTVRWIRKVFFPQLETHISKRNKIYSFKITGIYADDVVALARGLNLPILKRKWYQS